MKRILFFFLIIVLSGQTYAQHELGIFGGGSFYMGDINPNKLFNQTKPGYGIFFRYNMNTRIAFRASYMRGMITAKDSLSSFTPERGLYFKSNINEISVQAEFNFLDYFTGSEKMYFAPYLLGGAGWFFFNPKNEGDVALSGFSTENVEYSKSAFTFLIGIGVRYSISKRLEFGIEWGFRKTYTDYLDDVSTTYHFVVGDIEQNYATDPGYLYHDVDNGVVHYSKEEEYMDDPESPDYRVGFVNNVQRGESQFNDWYSFAGISLSYKINFKDNYKCNDYQFRPHY